MISLFPTNSTDPSDYTDYSALFKNAPIEYPLSSFRLEDDVYVNTQQINFGETINDVEIHGIGTTKMIQDSQMLVVILKSRIKLTEGEKLTIKPGDLELDRQIMTGLQL